MQIRMRCVTHPYLSLFRFNSRYHYANNEAEASAKSKADRSRRARLELLRRKKKKNHDITSKWYQSDESAWLRRLTLQIAIRDRSLVILTSFSWSSALLGLARREREGRAFVTAWKVMTFAGFARVGLVALCKPPTLYAECGGRRRMRLFSMLFPYPRKILNHSRDLIRRGRKSRRYSGRSSNLRLRREHYD